MKTLTTLTTLKTLTSLTTLRNNNKFLSILFAALNKKDCIRKKRRSNKRESVRRGADVDGGVSRDVEGISMPTKLTQLRYSGYSAEFLDRVEPNGNIPGKNGTAIAGM